MREAVKESSSSCGIYAYEAIKPIQELLAIARSQGIPIIYTTNDTRKEIDSVSVRATKRQSKIPEGAFKIREEFKPEPKDLIILKERASAFFGTPLIAHLIQHEINSLIVCGETDERLRSRQCGRRLFPRVPYRGRGGVLL